MNRYWQIILGYAVIHAVGWFLYAFWRESFPLQPEPTHSLMLSFALACAGEKA